MNRIESDQIPQTLSALLELRCSLSPAAPAFFWRAPAEHAAPLQGSAEQGAAEPRPWQHADWETLQRQCLQYAAALRHAGLTPGARVAMLLGQSPLWEPLAHAVYRNRAALVALEESADARDLHAVLRHCKASMLVTDAKGWQKLNPSSDLASADLAAPLTTVRVDDAATLAPQAGCLWLESLIAQSQDDARLAALPGPLPEDLATIVYTSGTTGTAKGIPFRHEQMIAACRALTDAYPELGPEDRTLCWLPLAAMFQRMANLLSMVFAMQTYLVDNPRAIVQEIVEIRPTFLIGVPRFYEKLDQALSVDPSSHLAAALKQAKLMLSGSAPIRVSVLESLEAQGIAVREAYGLSENTVPISLNRLSDYRFGTVGKPLPPNEVKLADDGEVLVKGCGLFSGYLGEPQDGQRFTEDGFYRTGDLGRFDEDGYLVLTGRKCDLIKTSTGRRIAPTKIEAAYAACPAVNQIVVIGDGQKYLAALLTPTTSWADAGVASPESLADFHRQLAAPGQTLSPHEQVQAFGLLPHPFGPGEVTSSQKLRRAAIAAKYAQLIERLYTQTPPCIILFDQEPPSPQGDGQA